MVGFSHLIDGRLVDSERRFEVLNPADESIVGYAPDASLEQLDAAVAAARAAFPAWSATDPEARRDAVRRLAEIITENRQELIDLLIREQGKPRANATLEVDRAAMFANITAGLTLGEEVLRDDDRMKVVARYRPLGVVGAIAPWNYPLLLGFWKVYAALVTGNCVILKPSPFTPLTTLRAGELFKDAIPPGVLGVLAGGDDLGKQIVAHPGIAKISFTGSTETGKKIVASGAANLKRVTLELGGNDAAIVLDDADPAEIAERIFWTAFNNSGQICMAIKRLYVHDSIYDEMCGELERVARSVPMGEGHEQGVLLGPVQNRPQFEKVSAILEDARQAGARLVACSTPPEGQGYFVPATLVCEAAEGMRVVDEEPFGPVLPIIRYAEIEDVVARANRTEYGLGGSVWTRDPKRGAEIASRLEAGTVWVNQHSVVLPDVPFGGHKNSGLGIEGAVEGLKHFCNLQVLNVAK